MSMGAPLLVICNVGEVPGRPDVLEACPAVARGERAGKKDTQACTLQEAWASNTCR